MKKLLALYLPQYHAIPENDEWWGKGYTEWSAVKQAKPLFKGHLQPREPLGDNYYDLSDNTGRVWDWQSKLAKEYGIYGFAIYHYWFGNGKMLLEKPLEVLLEHKEIDINYTIVWANESWTRTWYGLTKQVLAEQKYGDIVDWRNHFNYFLQFFKDSRYIKVDGKPVIHIYKTGYISDLKGMIDCWRQMAKENGFPGLYVVVGNTINGIEEREELVDAYYNFEPGFSQKYNSSLFDRCIRKIGVLIRTSYNTILHKHIIERRENSDSVYRAISKKRTYHKKTFLGTFPMWDNTPRRGYKGSLFISSPEKFYRSLKDIYERTQDGDFIYINAWNEWGEGCYLEPDKTNKYSYLSIVKKVTEGK